MGRTIGVKKLVELYRAARKAQDKHLHSVAEAAMAEALVAEAAIAQVSLAEAMVAEALSLDSKRG